MYGLHQRNMGIDLLRILSMLMVVILHLLGQGGIIKMQTDFGAGYCVSQFLELLCYCAVNCFGLISGFVAFNHSFKIKKVILFWLQAAFYSVGITLAFKFVFPQTAGLRDIVKSFFPVLTKEYWYFTAYFGLMFFIPYLNTLIQALSLKSTKKLLYTLFAAFSIFPMLANDDIFFIRMGYSLLWLTVLYLIGGCLGKLDGEWNISRWKCLSVYLICTVITFLIQLCVPVITSKLFGKAYNATRFISYNSPFMLLSGMSLLMIFKSMHIENYKVKKVIEFFSPLAFGVYLIHTHPMIWTYMLAGRFKFYSALPAGLLAPAVIGTAIGIYIVCTAIDFIRAKIFQLLTPAISRFTEKFDLEREKEKV